MAGTLYRTKKSITEALEELGVEEEDLADLEQCSHCSVWWYSYELIPDDDGHGVCRFCESFYGR